MDGSKPWWQSTGIWGALIAIVAVVLKFFGIELAEADQTALLNDIVLPAVAAVSALVALWGRIKATKKIAGE